MIGASGRGQPHDRSGPDVVVAVVGPTGVGKTALSLGLAHALDGEVVNADSMQLYRGMDIGTAKLPADQREGVPHHLLDLWPVTEAASVAGYQAAARAAIGEIRARGRTPVLVGGSGLYVRAVLDEFDFPGTDEALRSALEAELAELGPERLHARLARLDPAGAARILPSNGRRVVRALEVLELTGTPFVAELPEPRPHYPAVQLGVDRDTAELDHRLARRVDAMWADGLVDEVRRLESAGLRAGRTASRALGYQQILRLLAPAEPAAATSLETTAATRADPAAATGGSGYGEEQARVDTVTATRRFVRRQRSWFRRDPRIGWLDGARPDLLALALDRIRIVGEVAAARVGAEG
jgi:tRNA dimethylallyltransferase